MYLLFDAGASQVRLAVSSDGQSFGEPRIISTPTEVKDLAEAISKVGKELAGGQPIQAVVGGISRKLAAAEPMLKSSLAGPVYLYNDAVLVGLGEAVAGAGRGKNLVAYITVSSGVGGVRIVGGKLDQAAIGFEPGHQIINLAGPVQTLEEAVGGLAIEREMREPPASINDEAFWRTKAELLAVGVYNTILHWSPEVVVLGGSMMRQPGIVLAAVERRVRELNKVLPDLPEFKLGSLDNLGGLHGALAQLSALGLVS
jgi:predicted NBD/HSP70 family sugar kinase